MRSFNPAYLRDIDDPVLWAKCEKQLSQRLTAVSKPDEIASLNMLTDQLLQHLRIEELNGFFFSFTIPQISKEFDLLRFGEDCIINIELKSQPVKKTTIKKQLLQNRYYLKVVNTRIESFTYVSSENVLYHLDGAQELTESSPEVLCRILRNQKQREVPEINDLFRASDYLISPLNTPEKFIAGSYFLTNHQQAIKKNMLACCSGCIEYICLGLTGSPGTGKTLLLYDIAREFCAEGACCLIHIGTLCEGHRQLEQYFRQLRIFGADALENGEIDFSRFRYILVDESQRLHKSSFRQIVAAAKQNQSVLLFSFDQTQVLSDKELRRNIAAEIEAALTVPMETLTNKIRTNPELASFIMRVMDLKYVKDLDRRRILIGTVQGILHNHSELTEYELASRIIGELEKKGVVGLRAYPSISVICAKTDAYAEKLLQAFLAEGYQYIPYTAGGDAEALPDSRHVIGQEFSNVVMIMNRTFRYDEEQLLYSEAHPNPDDLYEKLLFQGMTRVTDKLALIIVDNQDVFANILGILQQNPY